MRRRINKKEKEEDEEESRAKSRTEINFMASQKMFAKFVLLYTEDIVPIHTLTFYHYQAKVKCSKYSATKSDSTSQNLFLLILPILLFHFCRLFYILGSFRGACFIFFE